MPRIRRQPDLSDVIAYAHGRKKKLKGPRREIYDFILRMCLGEGAANAPEKLCDECISNLQDRPSKRARQFERSQR